MEIEKVLKYLLIGNLNTGKIIYEMKNIEDLSIIFQIKSLFSTYSSKKNLKQQNLKMGSFYINISLEKLIMISETDINFPMDQNIRLFEKIRRSVPEINKFSLKTNSYEEMHNITSKITNVIFDFFQYININKQIVSESYFKIKTKNILKRTGSSNNNKKLNFKNNNNILIAPENSKIMDIDKSSTRQIMDGEIKNIVIEKNKVIDPQNEKLNNNKELDNANIIDDDKIIDKYNYTNYLLKELKNELKKIAFCRRCIIFILILIGIIQVVSIPLIILKTYSY
jgi:hypothetical protein